MLRGSCAYFLRLAQAVSSRYAIIDRNVNNPESTSMTYLPRKLLHTAHVMAYKPTVTAIINAESTNTSLLGSEFFIS